MTRRKGVYSFARCRTPALAPLLSLFMVCFTPGRDRPLLETSSSLEPGHAQLRPLQGESASHPRWGRRSSSCHSVEATNVSGHRSGRRRGHAPRESLCWADSSRLRALRSLRYSVLLRRHCSESLECRRCSAIFEAPSYHLGTLTRAQRRGVDFNVIDTGNVHFTLPPVNRIRHR